MKGTFSPCRRWVYYGIWFGCLSLLGIAVVAEAAAETAKQVDKTEAAKRDAKEAAQMVEAIVNRNKPPKIVRRRAVWPTKFPLFPKDYDWREEDRVRQALEKLAQDKSAELWEALVQKAKDQRYCITSYSGNTSDAEIYEVGRICDGLAYGRLCWVFQRHLPSLPPHGCPIQFGNIRRDFPAWRKERKGKSLYQLQIELCEMALRELPKLDVKDVSDKEKAEAMKKIEAEIKELRRTKEPFEKGGGIPRAYPGNEAKRVRKAYEEGTLEEFESRLNR